MENEIPVKTTNQLLVQHISEAALFTDAGFVITACNKAAAELFQYKQQEVLGFDITSLISTYSATNGQALTIKHTAFTRGTTAYINKAGKKISVHITRHAIAPYTATGGYLFLYKPLDDNHALPAGDEKLQWPNDLPGEAIIIFNTTYHCLDANINACRLTGYNRHELLDVPLKDLLHIDEADRFLPEETAWQYNEKIILEKKMRAKDGSAWHAELMLQQLADGRIFSFVRDITKQKKTELALMEATREFRKTTAQLREVSDHLLDIRETERKNIAREIHDELGQQLTILKMDISWLHQQLQKYEDPAVLQKTGDTLQLLNETIKTVRRIATELRPSMLDDLGLIEAIEWQSKEFEKRSGIKITFESGMAHVPVSNSIATSLFRIYQEALTNIARHAKAKNVLSNMQLDNDQLILTIKDDGTGFDMQTLGIKKTLGLLGMKERTHMMGGQFEINSKAGEGTTIVITTSILSDDAAATQTDQ
jgi:PAS domain S-box-containing protein